jgi:hypothetical protein
MEKKEEKLIEEDEEEGMDITSTIHSVCVYISYFAEAGIQATEHLRPELKNNKESKDAKSIKGKI